MYDQTQYEYLRTRNWARLSSAELGDENSNVSVTQLVLSCGNRRIYCNWVRMLNIYCTSNETIHRCPGKLSEGCMY